MDSELRKRARREGRSLNDVALSALERGLGVSGDPVRYHDLDDLIGTWTDDPAFDEALAAMHRVDPDLWQ